MVREGLRTPEVHFAAALSVLVAALRFATVRSLEFCGTPDACYYLGMAQTLSSGKGFYARFLYDFQLAHPTLPNTGIEYWRPGTSLFLLLLKPFHAVTLHGSIVLTIAVGILFAAAAWHIAMNTYGDRRLALGSFALCLLSSSEWAGTMSPDSGLYYGAAVAWFLALFTVRRQGLLQDVLALLCVCVAYLVRNDAALLLVPLVAVLWRRHQAANRGAPGASPAYAVAMLAGFILALLPMHMLYRHVLGTAFPGGTAQAFYMNDLGDFDRYNAPVSLHTLLSYGVKHLILFRVVTLTTVLYRILALMIGYGGAVFLPGLFARSAKATPDDPAVTRSVFSTLPELTGGGSFLAVAVTAYTLVLPAVGGFSALRTVNSVMPLLDVLVIVAILRVVRTPRLAFVVATAVILTGAVSGVMDDRRNLASMETSGATDRAEAQKLAALGADPASAVVLTGDPVQFSVTTGYATVALPSNGVNAIVQAAHDFRATHVMLNTEDLPATLEQLDRQLHPVRSIVLPAEHTLILALPPASGR